MAEYVLAPDAANDLDAIADYSIANFGIAQARRYRDELHRAFLMISNHPLIGRDQAHLRSGCRRHTHASHAIFYRIEEGRVVILRVLHTAQDPLRRLGDD